MTKVKMIKNGQDDKNLNKTELIRFFQEYFDIDDATEIWLDAIEYGCTNLYTINNVSYKFKRV